MFILFTKNIYKSQELTFSKKSTQENGKEIENGKIPPKGEF